MRAGETSLSRLSSVSSCSRSSCPSGSSPSLMDEGGILQFADDILHGRTLYRDVVVYAFPGVFYVTAAAFAVAGTSVGTARSLAALLFAIATAAVYLLARWSHGRRDALAIVLLFVCYRVWAFPHWHM